MIYRAKHPKGCVPKGKGCDLERPTLLDEGAESFPLLHQSADTESEKTNANQPDDT
jgi:hypothetical protein